MHGSATSCSLADCTGKEHVKQEQLHGAGRASRGKSAGGHPLFVNFLYIKYLKKTFAVENEGQCHRVQHSQTCRSIANINLCKCHMTFFFAIDLTVSKILTFRISYLEKLYRVKANILPFSGEYLPFVKVTGLIFARALTLMLVTPKL